MGFALKTASFSRRKALYHQLGIKDKDPEVNSYIQSLMHRIIELESEVTSLRTRLGDYESIAACDRYNQTQPLSKSVEPNRGETFFSSTQPSLTNELIRTKVSAGELFFDHKLKEKTQETRDEVKYVSRAFKNDDMHRKMKEDIIRKAMLCPEPESQDSKEETDHSLSNFDPAKVSNQYYEVSETERREVELIKPTCSLVKEPQTEEFNIILLESFDSSISPSRRDTGLKTCKEESEYSHEGRILESALNEIDTASPVHTYVEKPTQDDEDIMADKFELKPVSSRKSNSISMNWRKDRDNISFEVGDLNEAENIQMEVMTSRYIIKNSNYEDNQPEEYKSSMRRSKQNSVDKSTFNPSHTLGERSLNHRLTKTPSNCADLTSNEEKTTLAGTSDSHLKENRLDPTSKRRSLANKFSHVSSQLRSCYQRKPLSSDLYLQDRQSRSRSRQSVIN